MLNGGTAGDYGCAYVNFERGQTAREDVLRGMQAILNVIARRAESALGDNFVRKTWSQTLDESGPDGALGDVSQQWAEASPRPLVLLIDEVDALVGETFLAVLRQLRSSYDLRPKSFPHSIVLCGKRDMRDYRVHSRSVDRTIAGGSAFNINAKSLRLRAFTWDEVAALLNQNTTETGQRFDAEAHELVWSESRGQPWLVNALCDEAERGRDRSRAISADDILAAREELIRQRAAHLDQLADKLGEDRVRRVVEPILSGSSKAEFPNRDLGYVRGLG